MKKIIKDIPLYYREGINCFICGFGRMLGYNGYEIEATLGFRWGFFYKREKENSVTKEKEGYRISGYKQSLAEDLFKVYGITCRQRSTTDTEEAWKIAKNSLDNNKPLFVSIDMYHLPYYSRFYQQEHRVHNVILNGYDEEEDRVYIIDWWPPQLFKGIISIETLKQARNSLNLKDPLNSKYSRFSIQNRWLDIKYPSPRIELDNNLIKKVILENIEVMLGNDSKEDCFQGIRAIRIFAEDILEWIAHNDENLLITKVEKSFNPLAGIIGQRILHFDFLSNVSNKLEKAELRKMSEELDKIVQSWRVARGMFIKASRKEPEVMLPRISTRLLNIADREEIALIRLKDIILSS